MDHSRVVACHGFSSFASSPLNKLQKKLNRKMNCAPMVINAAILMKTCNRLQLLQVVHGRRVKVAARMPG